MFYYRHFCKSVGKTCWGKKSRRVDEILLAPHTSGPRDVPRCGALSSPLKSPPRGGSTNFAPGLNSKLWALCDCVTECTLSLLYRKSRISWYQNRPKDCSSWCFESARLAGAPLPGKISKTVYSYVLMVKSYRYQEIQPSLRYP